MDRINIKIVRPSFRKCDGDDVDFRLFSLSLGRQLPSSPGVCPPPLPKNEVIARISSVSIYSWASSKLVLHWYKKLNNCNMAERVFFLDYRSKSQVINAHSLKWLPSSTFSYLFSDSVYLLLPTNWTWKGTTDAIVKPPVKLRKAQVFS